MTPTPLPVAQPGATSAFTRLSQAGRSAAPDDAFQAMLAALLGGAGATPAEAPELAAGPGGLPPAEPGPPDLAVVDASATDASVPVADALVAAASLASALATPEQDADAHTSLPGDPAPDPIDAAATLALPLPTAIALPQAPPLVALAAPAQPGTSPATARTTPDAAAPLPGKAADGTAPQPGTPLEGTSPAATLGLGTDAMASTTPAEATPQPMASATARDAAPQGGAQATPDAVLAQSQAAAGVAAGLLPHPQRPLVTAVRPGATASVAAALAAPLAVQEQAQTDIAPGLATPILAVAPGGPAPATSPTQATATGEAGSAGTVRRPAEPAEISALAPHVAPPAAPAEAAATPQAAVALPGVQPTDATLHRAAAAEAPARQLAAPIAALLAADDRPAVAAGGQPGTVQAGPRSVTVTLRPAELGQVEIRVETRADGGMSIRLVAERPDTLALLQRDASQLDRALTQAGVATDGRNLGFDLGGQQPQNQQQQNAATPGGSGFGESQQGGRDGQPRSGARPGQPDIALAEAAARATAIAAASGRLDISI